MKYIDLNDSKQAYMFGFLQADGHLSKDTRNRGKLTLELRTEDESILKEFKAIIPVYCSIRRRERDTNFKKRFSSSILTVYNKDFREEINDLGIPYGSKSKIIKPPKTKCQKDYIRGLIDANGSLGITSKNLPFISLTSDSEYIKNYYLNYVYALTNRTVNIKRNKRDGLYNIMIMREDAQKIVEDLYYEDSISLERKKINAEEVIAWERPENMPKRDCKVKRRSQDEDDYIKNHTIEESMKKLNRTKNSIQTRLWRLSQ